MRHFGAVRKVAMQACTSFIEVFNPNFNHYPFYERENWRYRPCL